MSPTEFLLLLHNTPHIGEKSLARLIRLTSQQRLRPEDLISHEAEALQERYEIHAAAALALKQGAADPTSSAEMARVIRAHRIHLLSIESATYPTRLDRNDDAPPPLLYGLGNPALLAHDYRAEQFTFTVAVSNGASAEKLEELDALSTEVCAAGGIPVTGHDRPAYKRLALAAQRLDRPTVYVLDRGLREAMGPTFDRPLFAAARIRDAAFRADRDLALSPFRIDDHSIGDHNRRRDSLIFSLSDLIIALDVRATGSMAENCLRAAQRGRPVYVAERGRDGNDLLREQGCPPLPTGAERVKTLRRRLRTPQGAA